MKYRHLLEQHITYYNGQLYCYQCKITLQNLKEGKLHYEDAHLSVNSQISDFLNKMKLSKKNCMELVQQEENHCKYVNSKSTLKHSSNEQQKSNDNTNNEQSNACVNVDNSVEHKNESNAIIQSISENMLMKDTSNSSMQAVNETITNVPYALMEEEKTYKHFLMQRTIYTVHTYNGRWYCDLCEFTLRSLIAMTCHLQAVHPDSSTKISDFFDKSIKLSNTNCRELLDHEIAMQDVMHDYFCIPCKCSFPSVSHFYEHSVGKKHKLMTQCNKKHEDANVVLEKPTAKLNLNNNTINNQIISVVQNKSDLIRNLPSSFKAEEKSTILLKSYNKDSTSESLQSESLCLKTYIYTNFCYLCDMFINETVIKGHIICKSHKSAVSLFREIQISNQQTLCIIKLERERNTLRSLQLNNKKFDGTIWPEYAEIVAKYTCDQCNEMVEKDDIINHEITIHKSDMMFSMKFIYNWSHESRNLNAIIYYPLFKCSFCNEIIHGIASLQAHFFKYKHKENIKSLIDIKRREYDSCKNIEIYLEPIEFLCLISFENNGGTIQVQEQPVIYIKNHYTTLRKNAKEMQKTFIYVCFNCNYTADKINNAINHLFKNLQHLKHFENILLTYMSIQNVSTSKELIVNENEHKVKSPISKDVSIDNKSLTERNVDKIQVNTEQYGNRNLIAEMNSNNTDNRMSQNEENNSGFFISVDVFMEINTLIKKDYKSNQLSTKLNKSTVDRYNRVYRKDFLDFEEIMFVCNYRKLERIKSNLQFFFPSSDKIFCLICENLQLCNVQAIYEHINSENHIIKFNMLHENAEHLELLKQLVKIQPAYTKCYACDIYTFQNRKPNIDFKNHIRMSSHKINCNRLRNQIEFILKEFQNLWYSIQYFACVNCKKNFKIKINFMEHLQNKHGKVMRDKTNSMFDFCLTCATLWYKRSDIEDIHINYKQHCQLQMHRYLKKSNDFAITPLPQTLQKLLRNVNKISDDLFQLSEKVLNDPKATQLTDALKHIFGTCQPPAEVFMFGSRVTGLALTNSDIDIYLNFVDECIEPQSIKRRSKQIQDCLRTDHKNWDIELTLDRSRTPIIKVKHRLTGLQCDISFTKGLSVENSKLIRSFNTAYPPCQKLTLFLKKWLSLASLSGPDGMTNYALTWLVIFYLQVKLKIPSIADLIKSHNQSKIISGWETGVSDAILINVPEQPIHELLLGFFEYYGGFDYMRLVICPLLGETCQKKAFTEVPILPNSMALYMVRLRGDKREYFRIDSPMCVQDPYDLSHNLTKAVSILTLKRFKHYCNESLSVLRSVIAES
ncbi:Poly(A) RNA polymerase protein cid1 [Trachymyrmex cornetzi]|uniref:Poly(A) RNA polymerase protein cid1 n=1 Tax=Trachymyrmex cornetzi TaxID=471704 RepID=A0A195E4S2_9HYME|nr:Poly(A) RNA polymerase protein cid1 [Trachymyrmex cornetzi]